MLKDDIRWDVSTKTFLLVSIPLVIFLILAQIYGYAIWSKVLEWQLTRNIVFDLNPIFMKIPYNNAAFARIYQSETLTWLMRLVYNVGFALPAIIPIFRSFVAKDFKKMIRYTLASHTLQILLISPFYVTFHLQEVWYLVGHADGLARGFTPAEAAGWTLNCFPSMHTSISFAMFLVVLSEKDKIFKFIWSVFCFSIIYSTMYLEIHWIIDVIAGMIFAWLVLKLADLIIYVFENYVLDKLSQLLSKRAPSYTVTNCNPKFY